MFSSEKKAVSTKLVFNTRNRWATRTGDDMISKGEIWCLSDREIEVISLKNYHKLRIALGELSSEEKHFLNRVINTPFYAVHCSNAPQVLNEKGDLVLYSRDKLISKNITFDTTHTEKDDLVEIGDSDYVFFSLEAGQSLQKKVVALAKFFTEYGIHILYSETHRLYLTTSVPTVFIKPVVFKA